VKVPKKVFEGIEAVMENGSVNMFDYANVQRVAHNLGYYETVLWIERNQEKFLDGIFEGFEPDDN